MSLYGMMRTGGSGMNAQANRLGTVADNIANASTTGYKAASTEFSTLLLASGSGSYNSGAVQSQVRYNISQQGALTYTSSSTDLAINGNGFFVVQDAGGTTYMTRAGSFQPNAIGELVNAGGFKLLGYPYTVDNPTPVVNGFDGLVPVTVGNGSLVAKASTSGVFFSNLESTADVVTGTLPKANAAGAEYTHKSSLKVYDSLGNEVLLDIFFTKVHEATDTSDVDKWEVTVFNAAYRDPTTRQSRWNLIPRLASW
jgi:flagellar hook protein FlgE